jgi:hypothetical protein
MNIEITHLDAPPAMHEYPGILDAACETPQAKWSTLKGINRTFRVDEAFDQWLKAIVYESGLSLADFLRACCRIAGPFCRDNPGIARMIAVAGPENRQD